MNAINTPLLSDVRYIFALPSGEFVVIDLRDNANGNGQWVVEQLDRTGEFVAGLQLEPSNDTHPAN